MTTRIIAVSVACLLLASPVWADGETRPATRAEMDFMHRVHAAFQKAAPRSGPGGWEETERSGGEVDDRVTKGAEGYPMRLAYHLKWVDSAKIEAARQKMEEIARDQAASPAAATGPDPAQQRRYEELAAKIGAAAERGDVKTMERLQKEMEAVGQQMNRPFEESDRRIKAGSKAVAARDAYARLSIAVNESWISLPGASKGPLKQAPIAGNPVYRMNDESYPENYDEWVEGTTCVVLGPWKPANQGGEKGLAAGHKKKAPHTAVQSVNVCAQAEPARARALLEMVDWNTLKALLGN